MLGKYGHETLRNWGGQREKPNPLYVAKVCRNRPKYLVTPPHLLLMGTLNLIGRELLLQP